MSLLKQVADEDLVALIKYCRWMYPRINHKLYLMGYNKEGQPYMVQMGRQLNATTIEHQSCTLESLERELIRRINER